MHFDWCGFNQITEATNRKLANINLNIFLFWHSLKHIMSEPKQYICHCWVYEPLEYKDMWKQQTQNGKNICLFVDSLKSPNETCKTIRKPHLIFGVSTMTSVPSLNFISYCQFLASALEGILWC